MGYTYLLERYESVDLKPWEQRKVLDYILNDEGFAVKTYTKELKDSKTLGNEINEYKKYLKKELSNIRYLHETSGIYTSDMLLIKTDRESQNLIHSTYQAFLSNIISSIRWKYIYVGSRETVERDTTWKILSKTEFEEIVTELTNHIEKCFYAEEIIDNKISNISDVNELIGIDLFYEFSEQIKIL
jgi:hypothetical protein